MSEGLVTGRKLEAGSAILDPYGEPIAVARATWIELHDQPRGDGEPD